MTYAIAKLVGSLADLISCIIVAAFMVVTVLRPEPLTHLQVVLVVIGAVCGVVYLASLAVSLVARRA